MAELNRPPPAGRPLARSCGGCTLCCKVVAVPELDKPAGTPCRHCVVGRGCAIYGDRPEPCRTFACLWLSGETLGPEWRPDRSGIVLYLQAGGKGLAVHVDPDRPEAWRQEPFGSGILQFARNGAKAGGVVLVIVARTAFLIHPTGEIPLGAFEPGDGVDVREWEEDGALVVEARVVKPDDQLDANPER